MRFEKMLTGKFATEMDDRDFKCEVVGYGAKEPT